MASVMRFDEWQDSNGNAVASGTGGVFSAPGAILQVVNVVKTDSQAGTLSANSTLTITNFAPSITPKSATSTLIHFLDFAGQIKAIGGRLIITGGVSLSIGDAAGSRSRHTIGRANAESANNGSNITMTFLDTPGSTSTLTYGLQLGNWSIDSRDYIINRGGTDTDSASTSRTTSSWTILEVAN